MLLSQLPDIVIQLIGNQFTSKPSKNDILNINNLILINKDFRKLNKINLGKIVTYLKQEREYFRNYLSNDLIFYLKTRIKYGLIECGVTDSISTKNITNNTPKYFIDGFTSSLIPLEPKRYLKILRKDNCSVIVSIHYNSYIRINEINSNESVNLLHPSNISRELTFKINSIELSDKLVDFI